VRERERVCTRDWNDGVIEKEHITEIDYTSIIV